MLLFLYSYRRALQLINPIEQLTILSSAVRRDLRKWGKRANIAIILLNEESNPDIDGDGTEVSFNAAKAAFFQVNAGWVKTSDQAVHYAISYAKRFAEQGDYEVTEYAFKCIMLINATYCETKRGTFVGSNPFVEMPDTNDGFINKSLELLRQTMQSALAKGDERLAGSTLRGIGGLYSVYLNIEYPEHNRTKHHALLAAGYMSSAVESIVPKNMPDLMIEGISLMGRASRLALDHTNPSEIVDIARKIATLSTVGVLRTNHQPVTLIAFEQLADITYHLLVKGKHDIDFPIRQLRSTVTEATKQFLETPDTTFSSQHCNTLGPYFSSTSVSSLRSKLTTLVNGLLDVPADNAHARNIIDNIETWADQVYIPQKELLLLAVRKRSSFTFDVISWAVGIAELLNALSNAAACKPHQKDALRKDANGLISTLSWLPEDRESVTFVENYSLTESLFEAAYDGLQRDCMEFYDNCKQLLMTWAKKGGKHETGREILESAVKGLTALAIIEGTESAATELKTRFRVMLASDKAPLPELRIRAAANLARSADELQRHAIMHSRIEHSLAQLDFVAVRTLIHEMAEILTSDLPGKKQMDNGNSE